MQMKKFLAGLVAASMVLPLAACGSSDSGSTTTDETKTDETKTATADNPTEVKLKVWTPAEDQSKDYGNWLGEMEKKFEEAHPEYKITWTNEVCQEGDIGDKVTQDPQNSADVYLFANDQIGKLLDANAIAQLGGDVLKQVQDENSEVVLDSVTQDGKVYGVPFTTNTWFMYYNKKNLTEDDIKTVEGILDKGKMTFRLTDSWYNPAWFLADGGTMFGPDGNDAAAGVDFNKPAVTKYLVDLVANPNFSNDADGSGLNAFKKGEANVMFDGAWDYQDLKDTLGDDLGAAQLPTYELDGEAKQLKAFAGSKAIGVNPNTKTEYMKAAVDFAGFLGSEEAQKSHWELRQIIPTNTKLLEDPEIGENELVKAQNDTINNTSIIQPTITAMGQFWTIGENFGKAIVNKEVTDSNYEEKTTQFQEQLDSLKQ